MKTVDLSEMVTATYYNDEHEEWSQKTVAISDVLDSVCDDYTVIEAEPVKHGTWGENIYGYRKCSVCGRVTQVDECMREPLYLYCPYCGSRMDGEENDQRGSNKDTIKP